MNRVIVDAASEDEATKVCKEQYGWTPDAVREVDSGEEGVKAYMCFESAADAELWENQT